MLLIHIFSGKTNQVFASLETNIVSTSINFKRTTFRNCQKCFLSTAGAIRAKLISQQLMRPKRFSKLRRIYIAKYEVTASDFGFVNLEQNCASISQCGSVAVAYRSGSTRRSNQMPSQLLGDAKEPSGNLLCLIRRRTSATCRDCLRESSGSAYLGHFRMVTAIASDPLVIYALSTTRQVEYIVGACIASLACSKGIISIPGKICAPLIVDGPMPDTQITEENELALETFLTSKEFVLRSVHEQLTSITVTQNCMGPTQSSYQKIQKCLMCFARETGGFAVLLRMESGLKRMQGYYFHAFAQSNKMVFSKNCHEKCGKRCQTRNIQACNELNAAQFETSSIEDRISVGTREIEQNEEGNIAIEYSSKCVRASFQKGKKYCKECITDLGASADIAGLSHSMSLSLLRSDFEKKNLAACIVAKENVSPKCYEFVFVPDFMCEYEFAQSGQDNVQKQGNEFSAPSASGMDASQNQLLDSNAQSQLLDSNAQSQASASQRLSSIRLFGKNVELATNIVLVRYQKKNAYECIRSLALNHDVLMLSLKKQYIWMLYEPIKALVSVECEGLSFVKVLRHDVHAMRSISAANVEEIFSISELESNSDPSFGKDQDEKDEEPARKVKRTTMKKRAKSTKAKSKNGETAMSRAKPSNKRKRSTFTETENERVNTIGTRSNTSNKWKEVISTQTQDGSDDDKSNEKPVRRAKNSRKRARTARLNDVYQKLDASSGMQATTNDGNDD